MCVLFLPSWSLRLGGEDEEFGDGGEARQDSRKGEGEVGRGREVDREGRWALSPTLRGDPQPAAPVSAPGWHLLSSPLIPYSLHLLHPLILVKEGTRPCSQLSIWYPAGMPWMWGWGWVGEWVGSYVCLCSPRWFLSSLVVGEQCAVDCLLGAPEESLTFPSFLITLQTTGAL